MLARELHETSDLLSEVLDALQGSLLKLPSQDRHIGAYVYDMQERSRGVGIVYSRLEANYRVSELLGGVYGCSVEDGLDACQGAVEPLPRSSQALPPNNMLVAKRSLWDAGCGGRSAYLLGAVHGRRKAAGIQRWPPPGPKHDEVAVGNRPQCAS